jgi:GDP-D-mannose dehydratase
MTHVDEAECASSLYSNEIAALGSNKTPASTAQKTPLAEGYRGKSRQSPLRPARFVSRKITSTAVRIAGGSRERLALGNLSIQRDWGWAPEYVEAMWTTLQRPTPDDFVIASGAAHSLEQFVEAAFTEVSFDWRDWVDNDSSLLRPSDISYSVGDPRKRKCSSIGSQQ